MGADGQDDRILRALASRVRPYESKDVAIAAGLSLAVVRCRLYRLRDAGLVEETWKGDRGPFWRVAT
jgi:DNA-binding Lrp family transcriptional regulator